MLNSDYFGSVPNKGRYLRRGKRPFGERLFHELVRGVPNVFFKISDSSIKFQEFENDFYFISHFFTFLFLTNLQSISRSEKFKHETVSTKI